MPSSGRRWLPLPLLFATVLLLLAPATFAQTVTISPNGCNTNENPYCKNDKAFESLCCPYPNRCYYVNRYGAVGCCPEGETCDTCEDEECTTTTQPTPQPIVTITPTPTPEQTTVYNTVVSVTTATPVCENCCDTCESQGSTVTITPSQVIATSASGIVATITEGVSGVVSTITSAAAVGFSTVSGVLVGAAVGRRRSELTELLYLLFGVLGALIT